MIRPLDVPGVTRDANPQVRFTFWAARRAPFLLGPMGRAMARITLKNPDKAAERLIGMRPPADREIIRRPEVMAVLRENLPNQFNEPASMALEMANAARPWGFDREDVTVPTTIWQGGFEDRRAGRLLQPVTFYGGRQSSQGSAASITPGRRSSN